MNNDVCCGMMEGQIFQDQPLHRIHTVLTSFLSHQGTVYKIRITVGLIRNFL